MRDLFWLNFSPLQISFCTLRCIVMCTCYSHEKQLSSEVWNAHHSTSIQLCYPGCQERVPPGDDSYQASSSIQPPRLARLNSSNPGASVVAWCRGLDNENGYVQIDLGRSCYFVKMKKWKHITLNCMEIWLMPRPKWWDQLTRLWYSCRYRMAIGDFSHLTVSFATLNNEISSHEH